MCENEEKACAAEKSYVRALGRWLLYALALVLASLVAALVQKWTGVAPDLPPLPVPAADVSPAP